MAKKRVHEIAKERGITSKEALEILQKAGLGVTAPASSVEEADAAKAFGNGATATKAPAKPKKAAAKDDGAKAEAEGRREGGGEGLRWRCCARGRGRWWRRCARRQGGGRA